MSQRERKRERGEREREKKFPELAQYICFIRIRITPETTEYKNPGAYFEKVKIT